MAGIFSQYDSQDLNRIAAKGILEKLRNIRQRINVDFTARRLIWELIQNAKDNAATCNINGQSDVRIEIELNSNQLRFSHDNGFFSNENIRGLIRRYSSSDKDRVIDASAPPPATTGRFGTGFMTTHLLSEKVLIKGVFQESSNSYCKFEFPLDRTGQSEPEVIKNVENAFFLIEESIKPSTRFGTSNPTDFKTEFLYTLEPDGYELASISINEFDDCIAYTLINIPNIERVSVIRNGANHYYEIEKIKNFQTNNNDISIIKVCSNNHASDQKYFATILKENTRITIPISYSQNKIEILNPDDKVPRLFLDFPMIGTEDMNIPFVINNPLFEPTELRDGISLTGGNDKDTQANSKIIIEAFNLYKDFIDFASSQNNWDKLFNLARIKNPEERIWLNAVWMKTTIIQPIQTKLLNAPIVDTNSGQRVSIQNTEGNNQIYFPYARNKDIRERIWILTNDLYPNSLPKKEHIHEWDEIIWDECYQQTLGELIEDVQKQKDIKSLSETIKKDEEKTIDFLNDFFVLINLEGKFIDEIIKDKYSVIPNQNGIFKKRSELFIDIDIDDELKNVLAILNIDLREKLKHKLINTYNKKYKDENDVLIRYSPKKQEDVIDDINKIIREGKNDNLSKACDYLSSCFANDENFPKEQNLIYEFCKALWEMPEKKVFKNWSEQIWQEVNKLQIKWIIQTISADKNIDGLSKTIESNRSETLKWLNSFIEFLISNDYENHLNLKSSPILPNQNGIFCVKDNLFLDDGKIDSTLKDIAYGLGYDIRNELLDIDISIVLPENRVRTQEQLAEEISKLIKPILRDVNEREENKDVIRKLYLWMNKYRVVAEEIFGEIFEKRFLLISDDEITSNIEKAEMLDEILEETGLSTVELKVKLKEIINPQTTGLYPIGSEEDILISPSLFDGSSEKSRISVSQEAKEIIFKTLRDKSFNIPDNIKISYTIIDGVISPSGKPIKIVVKSAKAGKLYFNPSEWLALTEPDSQLFVLTSGNKVKNITLTDIEKFNDIFHMRFNTRDFALTNLKAFANFFRYLPYTHFIFETPDSTTDYLEQFGLNERNPSSNELSPDDKNLLH